MNLKETDVILNFMEDCKLAFIRDSSMEIEFPAGSWVGKKNRNVADIHGPSIPGIEAKSDFTSCKKDIDNSNKNEGISHYIYSSSELKTDEIKYWQDRGFSAAVFLIDIGKWLIIRGDREENFCFSQIIKEENIHEVHRK